MDNYKKWLPIVTEYDIRTRTGGPQCLIGKKKD